MPLDKMLPDKMPPTVEFVFIFFKVFQFVALPFSMSQPMIISPYHKLYFTHTHIPRSF